MANVKEMMKYIHFICFVQRSRFYRERRII